MRKVWVIATNASYSKIYRAESNDKLVELAHFEHEESRLLTRDLVSDGQPGRSTERQDPRMFATHGKTPARLKEKDHFAEEIATYLEECLIKGEYERLYVIAGPQFLSLLNHHLSSNVKKAIFSEIPKDLSKQGAEEVRAHLPPIL